MKKSTRPHAAQSPKWPLILAVGVLAGTIGLYLTGWLRATSAPLDSTKPRIIGLLDRKGVPDEGYRVYNGKPLVKNFVVNAEWNKIEDQEGVFRFESIQSQIDKAAEMGAQVRLRIFAGKATPGWVKDKVGSVRWIEPVDRMDPYQLPKFWTLKFQSYYKKFLKKMSDKYDGNSVVSEVTMAMCSTTYAEPLIRQAAVQENKDRALTAGYTYAADYSCLTNEIDMYDARNNVAVAGKLFKNTRVTLAINPYQAFNPPAGRSAATDTINIMLYCRHRLGKRCVLGNNSIQYPVKEAGYEAIYAKQKSLGKPLYYQTATPGRIGNWQNTLQWAVDQGASSVELNAEYNSYDKAQLASYAQQLREN